MSAVLPSPSPAATRRAADAPALGSASRVRALLADAAAHYSAALRASPRAVSYLRSRGIGGAVAARFGLGYALPSWQGLSSVLRPYDRPTAQASGLLVQSADSPSARGGRLFDRFRDRVMFPIRDLSGSVVGFGGRCLDGSDPKYMNSPESELFKKRDLLYGLFEADASIRSAGRAVVVEGYLDVLTLAQAGFESVVATLGTACSASHVSQLAGMCREVVFCFDGDPAGLRAAEKAFLTVLPSLGSCSFRFMLLPGPHDPDSLVREQGLDSFLTLLDGSLSVSDFAFVLAASGCDLGSAEGRARLAHRLGEFWRVCPDEQVQGAFLEKAADVLGLPALDVLGLWGGVAAGQ